MEHNAKLLLPAMAKWNLESIIGMRVYGLIYEDSATYGNHPFKDGTCVHTSCVKEVRHTKTGTFLVTDNSVYLVDFEELECDHYLS